MSHLSIAKLIQIFFTVTLVSFTARNTGFACRLSLCYFLVNRIRGKPVGAEKSELISLSFVLELTLREAVIFQNTPVSSNS